MNIYTLTRVKGPFVEDVLTAVLVVAPNSKDARKYAASNDISGTPEVLDPKFFAIKKIGESKAKKTHTIMWSIQGR